MTFLAIGCVVSVGAACAPVTPAAPASSSTPDMTSMSSATPTAPVAANSVSIKDFAFAPSAVTVKAGTTVTWTNADQDPHTVTSTDAGGPLRSTTLSNGDSYEYTFTRPGTYAYLCTIHPFMTATVVVTA